MRAVDCLQVSESKSLGISIAAGASIPGSRTSSESTPLVSAHRNGIKRYSSRKWLRFWYEVEAHRLRRAPQHRPPISVQERLTLEMGAFASNTQQGNLTSEGHWIGSGGWSRCQLVRSDNTRREGVGIDHEKGAPNSRPPGVFLISAMPPLSPTQRTPELSAAGCDDGVLSAGCLWMTVERRRLFPMSLSPPLPMRRPLKPEVGAFSPTTISLSLLASSCLPPS